MFTISRIRIALAIGTLAFGCMPAWAQTTATWTGGTGNWSVASNWNPFGVPNSSSVNVLISRTGSNISRVNFDLLNGTVGSLTLDHDNYFSVRGHFTARDTHILTGSTVDNFALFHVQGGALRVDGAQFTGSFHNLPGAVLLASGSGSVHVTGTFLNAGTIDMSNNDGIFDVTAAQFFSNAGTIRLGPDAHMRMSPRALDGGGTIELLGSLAGSNPRPLLLQSFANLNNMIAGGGLIGSLGQTLINHGTLLANSGAPLTVAYNVNNFGNLTVARGSTFRMLAPTFAQSSGTTRVDGVFEATVAEMRMQGGLLTGAGSIMANVRMEDGQLNPGDVNSAGALTITGKYFSSGTSALTIELNGALSGQYDQLLIGQTAALNGTLNIVLLNGFIPQAGDTFRILGFALAQGTFRVVNGILFNNGFYFDVLYNANDVTLVANQVPEPASLALFASGLGLLFYRTKRARKT